MPMTDRNVPFDSIVAPVLVLVYPLYPSMSFDSKFATWSELHFGWPKPMTLGTPFDLDMYPYTSQHMNVNSPSTLG